MGVWYGGNAHYCETATQREATKFCKTCGRDLPLSAFSLQLLESGRRRYAQKCKECNAAGREAAKRARELAKTAKTCSKCGKERPYSCFVREKDGKVMKTCSKCREAAAEIHRRKKEAGANGE